MRNLLTIFLIAVSSAVFAVEPITVPFVQRDSTLYMDIYMPDDTASVHPCYIYVFGGGFKRGQRNQNTFLPVFKQLTNAGIVCVSIDYRLGLKDYKLTTLKEAVNRVDFSIDIAVEDLYAATKFLIDNSKEYKINTAQIVASGSSAGAITSLQADYYLHSDNEMAKILPSGFKYAGIIPFAGAVACFGSKLKYTSQPAPTYFFHGTEDKLVTYSKIDVFGIKIYGSDYLAKQFKKNGWLYKIVRYENFGHEIAIVGFKENALEIIRFFDTYVTNHTAFPASTDEVHYEEAVQSPLWNINPLTYYKGVPAKITEDPVMQERLK